MGSGRRLGFLGGVPWPCAVGRQLEQRLQGARGLEPHVAHHWSSSRTLPSNSRLEPRSRLSLAPAPWDPQARCCGNQGGACPPSQEAPWPRQSSLETETEMGLGPSGQHEKSPTPLVLAEDAGFHGNR